MDVNKYWEQDVLYESAPAYKPFETTTISKWIKIDINEKAQIILSLFEFF